MNLKTLVSELDNIQIIETEEGFATYSTISISKGEIIFPLKGESLRSPNKYTIQLSESYHIIPKYGKYVNHSCMPNTYIDFENKCMRALMDIHPNEEITFNYNTSEYIMADPFKCKCGSLNCIREIKGFKFLDDEQKKLIEDFLPDYLKYKIEQQ